MADKPCGRQKVIAAVRLRGVAKSFPAQGREVEALANFSMDVARGEFAVVLGPSGCGKSTAIRIIAGLETPTSGTILVDGEPVVAPGRHCSMVFQTYTSFPWLSVLDNIAFGLRYSMPGAPRDRLHAAREYACMVGLEAFADARIYELSGGMKQRVAIASALATDRPLLLMDEPFGALDSQTRMEMQELLLRVVDRPADGAGGKTVVFVTHDIEEALLLGDRIYVCTSRPARILAELDVPFPRPRTLATRNQRTFFEMKHTVFGLLREHVIAQEVERMYELRRQKHALAR
jgi:NitT/TauT family transport system ATP-binding protein